MFRNVMTYLGLGPDEEYDDGYLYDEDADDEHLAPVVTDRAPAGSAASRSGFGHEPEEASAVGAVRPLRPVRTSGGEAGRADLDDEEFPAAAAPVVAGRGGAFDRSGGAERGGAFDRSGVTERGGAFDRTDRTSASEPAVAPERARRSIAPPADTGSAAPARGFDAMRNEPVVRPVPIQRTKPRALSPQSFGDAKLLADDIKQSVPVIMNLRDVDRDLARRLIDFASGVCYSLDASMEKLASQVFLLTPASVEVSDDERRRIEERGFDR